MAVTDANKLPREATQQGILEALRQIKSALDSTNSSFSSWAGSLSNLTTTEKSNLVAAINSLVTVISSHTTKITALENTAQDSVLADDIKNFFQASGLYIDDEGGISQIN